MQRNVVNHADGADEEIANRKWEEQNENLPLSPGLLVPLSSRASQTPLPNAELTRIGREIALRLAAAHRRGLIHRDIKPSNIRLEEETGRVKILDFGLARVSDGGEQLTHSGSLLGTPAYMSPEQTSGVEADARSDLFSLGCVLYHCATGRRPFVGRDTLSTLVAVTTTEPPPPRELNPALPEAINDLILSLLVKDRDQRLQTAREVAERLASVGNALSGVPDVEDRHQEEESVGNALCGVPAADTAADSDGIAIVGATVAADSTSLAASRNATEGVLYRVATERVPYRPGADDEKQPPRRRGLILLTSAAAAAALLAGIIITIKNEKGETVAKFEAERLVGVDKLAPGHTITVGNKAEGKRQKAEEEGTGNSVQGSAAEPKTHDISPKISPSNPKSEPLSPKTQDLSPLVAMSAMSLVTQPAPIQGLTSWTLETIDHRGDIYKMEFNPDGTLLATYGEDGAVRLWNSDTGELARMFVSAGFTIGRHRVVTRRRFDRRGGRRPDQGLAGYDHSDGRVGSYADAPVAWWEWEPRYALSSAKQLLARSGRHLGGPLVLDWTTGAQRAFRRQTTMLWETEEPKFCGAWSHDGNSLAMRGEDGRIWDAETGEVIARLPGAALAGETGASAWSPDGTTHAGRLASKISKADINTKRTHCHAAGVNRCCNPEPLIRSLWARLSMDARGCANQTKTKVRTNFAPEKPRFRLMKPELRAISSLMFPKTACNAWGILPTMSAMRNSFSLADVVLNKCYQRSSSLT